MASIKKLSFFYVLCIFSAQFTALGQSNGGIAKSLINLLGPGLISGTGAGLASSAGKLGEEALSGLISAIIVALRQGIVTTIAGVVSAFSVALYNAAVSVIAGIISALGVGFLKSLISILTGIINALLVYLCRVLIAIISGVASAALIVLWKKCIITLPKSPMNKHPDYCREYDPELKVRPETEKQLPSTPIPRQPIPSPKSTPGFAPVAQPPPPPTHPTNPPPPPPPLPVRPVPPRGVPPLSQILATPLVPPPPTQSPPVPTQLRNPQSKKTKLKKPEAKKTDLKQPSKNRPQSPLSPKPKSCDNGWVNYAPAKKCFLFSKATVLAKNALQFCRKKGANLTSIHNQKENDFILNHLPNKPFYFFIGLAKKNNKWAWTDGSQTPYRNWQPSRPYSDAVRNMAVARDVVAMANKFSNSKFWSEGDVGYTNYNDYKDGKWIDVASDYEKGAMVCQKRATL